MAFEGSLARKLDFGELPGRRPTGRAGAAAAVVRLVGPDKYRALERRRRKAQIAARHLLDLAEAGDAASTAARG